MFSKVVFDGGILCYLILVVSSTLGGTSSGGPEGSTGCSKNWGGGAGRCWRYCFGSEGKWCYTTLNCTHDEESCANYAQCTVECAPNSALGCVNSCNDVSRGKVDTNTTTSNTCDLSLRDTLDTIGTHLTEIQDKLDSSITGIQERNVPHMLFLGRIGAKVFYRSLGMKLSWIDGLHFCRSNGLQMAVIDSTVEQLALQSFFTTEKLSDPSTTPQKAFWIGGMWVKGGSTDFYWMNTGRKFGYTNWDVGQPDYPDSEFCVQVWKDNQKWNNAPCMFQCSVICERDLLNPTTF